MSRAERRRMSENISRVGVETREGERTLKKLLVCKGSLLSQSWPAITTATRQESRKNFIVILE